MPDLESRLSSHDSDQRYLFGGWLGAREQFFSGVFNIGQKLSPDRRIHQDQKAPRHQSEETLGWNKRANMALDAFDARDRVIRRVIEEYKGCATSVVF